MRPTTAGLLQPFDSDVHRLWDVPLNARTHRASNPHAGSPEGSTTLSSLKTQRPESVRLRAQVTEDRVPTMSAPAAGSFSPLLVVSPRMTLWSEGPLQGLLGTPTKPEKPLGPLTCLAVGLAECPCVPSASLTLFLPPVPLFFFLVF